VLCHEFGWEGPNKEKMTDEWKERAELLLSAQGSPRCHVISIFGQRLNWLYHADPLWTEEHVILGIELNPRTNTSHAALMSFVLYGGVQSRDLFLRLKPTLIALAADGDSVERHEAKIPVLLLMGWNSRDEAGERLISDEDMREILLSLDDEVRVEIIRQLGLWARRSGDWSGVVTFVESVWPRQLVARTRGAASALASLAMSAGEAMPEVTRVVVSLISPADDSWTDPLYLRAPNDDLVERFPEEHLAVLHAATGADQTWVPNITAALIGKLSAIESTRHDPRLREVQRRITKR
jgi:hypothetical protein